MIVILIGNCWLLTVNGKGYAFKERSTKGIGLFGYIEKLSDRWVPNKWAPGQMSFRQIGPGQMGTEETRPDNRAADNLANYLNSK